MKEKLEAYLKELKNTSDIYTPDDMLYRQGEISAVEHVIKMLNKL